MASCEILVTTRGETLLLVAAHVTDADARVSERAWPVREFQHSEEMVERVAGGRTAWEGGSAV